MQKEKTVKSETRGAYDVRTGLKVSLNACGGKFMHSCHYVYVMNTSAHKHHIHSRIFT